MFDVKRFLWIIPISRREMIYFRMLHLFSINFMNLFLQILHVIDDVLIPLSTGNRSANEIYSPDALTFLTNANSFDIGSHRVRSFYQRVVVNKKESLFQADGFHTFFIPVEEGFKVIMARNDPKINHGNYYPLSILIASTTPRHDW